MYVCVFVSPCVVDARGWLAARRSGGGSSKSHDHDEKIHIFISDSCVSELVESKSGV